MTEAAHVSVFTQQKAPVAEDIDELGHVNNAVYVRWIQDIAVAHWYSVAPADLAANVVWVVVRHEIDYRAPSHLGETLTLRTWVGDAPKGARYDRFVEVAGPDGKVRVRALTTWALLDRESRRPMRVTADITAPFVSKKSV
jgi:acyl-CoA thioester hydrolase